MLAPPNTVLIPDPDIMIDALDVIAGLCQNREYAVTRLFYMCNLC